MAKDFTKAFYDAFPPEEHEAMKKIFMNAATISGFQKEWMPKLEDMMKRHEQLSSFLKARGLLAADETVTAGAAEIKTKYNAFTLQLEKLINDFGSFLELFNVQSKETGKLLELLESGKRLPNHLEFLNAIVKTDEKLLLQIEDYVKAINRVHQNFLEAEETMKKYIN